VNSTNYLVPVDANLARDYDVEDEAVALDRIIWALQPVRRLRLILLDACRDNPFVARLQRSVLTRAAPKSGLGKLDDVSADTLVAYAAKEGSVSYDGNGSNSPFATAVLKHITEPGLDIRIALGRVRDEVMRTTSGRQEPFIYGSLGGSIIPLVPLPVAKALEAMTVPSPVLTPSVALATPAPVVSKPPPALPPPVDAKPPAAPPGDPSQSMLSRLQAALEKENQASACSRDEQRLARLRSMPSADEITRFERELACARLKPQVQRLFESIATTLPATAVPLVATPPAPAPAVTAPPGGPPRKEDPGREEVRREEPRSEPQPALATTREQSVAIAGPQGACARDAERLAQLRGDPSLDAITRFDRELSCERLRPQLRRLRESLQ
jgi:hypothetical protein